MTFLSVEEVSKRYGLKVLFEGLTFGLSEGDKTALVAPNGTGKSTLLRVLAGQETPDNGKVMYQNGVRTGFLEQEPELDDQKTILEFINSGSNTSVSLIRRYEAAADAQAADFNPETQKAYQRALSEMDAANAWDYEQRMKQILGRLRIVDLDQPISSLSGGERKRVALAFVLLDEPDLLLLDEPTNHLDLDMIEWLEQYLARTRMTLLMVTHDRYFLDRVCNHIIEIDSGTLYHHKGNYEYYLQKKSEREENEQVALGKAKQHYKKELEWMRRGPKARTSKSKSRIDAFHETAKRVQQETEESELRLEMDMTRMGDKIVELTDISKQYGENVILENFSYSFKRGERIGIIGRNGAGKSTFLNILTGKEPADHGKIDKGSTVQFGHYEQKGLDFDESMRVIDILKQKAEVIQMADGSRISASRFLEFFMFTPEMQYTFVSRLSGGEKRRLALMMVLIQNPNFLILDEPTNDLDLMTLNRLESFLEDFGGCLIIVSHDRFFMDRLVQHYFVFEGEGRIRDFHGTYQEYRDELARQETDEKKTGATRSKSEPKKKEPKPTGRGLTYKEKKTFQKLGKEIEVLEKEQMEVEKKLSGSDLNPEELAKETVRYGEIQQLLDQKGTQWLELAERDR